MDQPSSPYLNTTSTLKFMNKIIIVGAVLSLPLVFVLDSATMLYILLLIACSFVVAVRSRANNLHLGRYAFAIGITVIITLCIALAGFYGSNTTVVNEFGGDAGTNVSDRTVGTAIKESLLRTDTFTAAALFGLNCSGPDCSNSKWAMGTVMDYVILTGGVITGNMLVKKQVTISTLAQK